jgi:proteasome alpha subunit
METVKRGATVLGMTCREGAILVAEERPTSKLQDPRFNWKLFQVDEHVGAAIAGLSSDARILVDQARIYAQSSRLLYDEPVDIEVLTKRTGDLMQMYTQHAGMRPFGVSLLFSGVDKTGPRLFQTDPGGNYFGLKASAVGAGGELAKEVLEAEYRDDMTLDEAMTLALKCLSRAMEGKLDAQKVVAAVIPVSTKKFRMLTKDELTKYVEGLSAI